MAFLGVIERKRKTYLERRDHGNDLNRKLFRFTEDNLEWLTNHFMGQWNGESRGGALSNTTKMKVFLRSLADPGHQLGVGVDLGLHQTTVSKVIKEVIEKIVAKKYMWIHFPSNENEFQSAKNGWRIPNTIGIVDCTHIRISKPVTYGEEYFNRKGYSFINVQATCNFPEIFTSIDASWPGSVHDSRIWKNSTVYRNFSNNQYEACLLGDEGYGIAPWLLVPYKEPVNAHQRLYNKIHTKNRIIIERCFGQLKRRFPMLLYTVRLKTERVCSYVTAACILHNAAKYLNDPDDFTPMVDEQPFCGPIADHGVDLQIRREGQQRRDQIAQELFNLERWVDTELDINQQLLLL